MAASFRRGAVIYQKQFTIGSMALLLLASAVLGADHQGVVRIGEVPVPGASVQATQGTKALRRSVDLCLLALARVLASADPRDQRSWQTLIQEWSDVTALLLEER